MPRRGPHFVIAAVTSVADQLITHDRKPIETRNPLTLKDILGTAVVGGFAGLLPDLLEPAFCPRHRGLCHSLALMALLVWLLRRTPGAPEDALARAALVGYLSHLGADLSTPMGLPVIGLKLA